jgi:hypothetical protein
MNAASHARPLTLEVRRTFALILAQLAQISMGLVNTLSVGTT